MAKPAVFAFVLASALAVAWACSKDEDGEEDERTEVDPALAAIEIDAAVTSDQDGTMQAVVEPGVANTQVIRASESSRIKTTTLAFPPGAFDIPFEVMLSEGRNIATKANLVKLFDETVELKSAGPAVVVTWTYDEDSFVDYRLKMPVPAEPAPKGPNDTLIVVYIKNRVEETESALGFLPPSAYTVEGGFVAVSSKAYGVFQPVYVDRKVTAGKEVLTSDKEQPIGKIEGVLPGSFAITGPTETLASAKHKIDWDLADLATSFTVKLDQKSAACAAPYLTLTDLKVTNLAMNDVKDGDNFVCVSAVNAAGATAASNNGFKFKVDRSAPPAPGKPAGNGPVTDGIEVLFSWNAVTDVGPAGLSYYQLEVGTEPNGADVFNGPVADATSKSLIGFDGKKYYARVRAVDTVGNESDWSPLSDAVEVDSH